MLIVKEDNKHFTIWLDEIDVGELVAIQSFVFKEDSSVPSEFKPLNIQSQMTLDTADMTALMFQFDVVKKAYEILLQDSTATSEEIEFMKTLYEITTDFVTKLKEALN